MKFRITTWSCGFAAAAVLAWAPGCLHADSIIAESLSAGYQASSIELGQPFGGSIAQHPTNANLLYVSYGDFAFHKVMAVALDTGSTRTVTPYLGNVGGLAVLNNGDLAISENDDFTSDTILRARDLNGDGDFIDVGEITELIAPILTTAGNFTGAQMTVAPAGNAAGIPAGSLVVQTADGGTNSELLVIENPETAPAFRPVGGGFYTGFTYNGGVGFSHEGHVICGVSEFPVGRIDALVNTNGDMDIDAGEAHTIADGTMLTNSLADLSVTADGRVITSENGGTIRSFQLPGDLLTGMATPSVLAVTNASYISTVRVDFPDRPFGSAPGARSTLYAGGYVTFPAATNLLAIKALAPASVEDWRLFE